MDYKAPPQYSTPPPVQQAAYPPQQPGPAQYGSPAPQHPQAYPPQQPQPQYGAPIQQQPAHPQQYPPQQYPPQQYPPQQHAHAVPAQQYPPPQQQPQAVPQQQYQAAAPMQRGVAPAGAAPGSAAAGSSEWNASLMDCSPCDSCCLGCFLPCVLLGNTSDRMRDPTMQSADSMNSDCMVFTAIHCFTGCGWIYIMMKRSEIRERFGIAGSGGADCCTTFWCPCCALIQQDNEVKIRTAHMVNNQGYQAQPGMVMPQK